MTQEELTNKLKIVKTEWINHDEFGFSRTLRVKTDFSEFKIIWFINHSTLILSDGTEILFDNCGITGSWPSQTARLWLDLYFDGIRLPIHIPLINYQK